MISAATWAADEPKPNPIVEKAMASALADAEKGYDSYRAILAKATDKAVKDMEKAKLDVMKKGDLASANELDARIKELKEGGLEKLVMERKKAGGDLLGEEADLKNLIIGKWRLIRPSFPGEITFSKGGACEMNSGGKVTGTYEIKSGIISVSLANGVSITINRKASVFEFSEGDGSNPSVNGTLQK